MIVLPAKLIFTIVYIAALPHIKMWRILTLKHSNHFDKYLDTLSRIVKTYFPRLTWNLSLIMNNNKLLRAGAYCLIRFQRTLSYMLSDRSIPILAWGLQKIELPKAWTLREGDAGDTITADTMLKYWIDIQGEQLGANN